MYRLTKCEVKMADGTISKRFEFITAPESTAIPYIMTRVLHWVNIVDLLRVQNVCRLPEKMLCFNGLTWYIHQYFKVSVGTETLRTPFSSSLVQNIHVTCWRTLLSIRHSVLSHHHKHDIEVDVFRLLERQKLINAIQKNECSLSTKLVKESGINFVLLFVVLWLDWK